MKKLLLISIAIILSGCSQSMRYVQDRAPFDLDCPKEKVQIHKLGDMTYGATGCNKRITYSVHGYCDGIGWCEAKKEATEIIVKQE